jgi:TolB-like protein
VLFWWLARPKAIDSLAVLPFANASADPTADYLRDGMTETLTETLSQLPNLRVMSRRARRPLRRARRSFSGRTTGT